MAWCPKCKNEYVEGFTHCPDCDVDLVDELMEEEELEYIPADDFQNPDDVIDYLHQVSVSSALLTHLEDKDIDVIAIAKKEFENAKPHIYVYLQNQNLAKDDESVMEDNIPENSASTTKGEELINTASTEESSPETNEKSENYDSAEYKSFTSPSITYTKLSDKYEDVKSSAYTLLIIGIMGSIGMLMEAMGVFKIPISPHTKWLFYTVLGGIFIAFIISGIISLMHAKQLKIDAKKEDSLIDKIMSWFSDNYTKEIIDEAIDTDLQEELLYFNRAEYIKNVIMHEFEDVDEALIDSLIETIYSDLFE